MLILYSRNLVTIVTSLAYCVWSNNIDVTPAPKVTSCNQVQVCHLVTQHASPRGMTRITSRKRNNFVDYNFKCGSQTWEKEENFINGQLKGYIWSLVHQFSKKGRNTNSRITRLYSLNSYMLCGITVATTKMMRVQGTKGDQGCKFNVRCLSLVGGARMKQTFKKLNENA